MDLIRGLGLVSLLLASLYCHGIEYQYPFDDPYVATVVGTPADWHVRFDQPAPAKHYGLPPVDGKTIPEVFWYQDRMHYALAAQQGEAPLIFVIAGTGAGFDSSKMRLLMNAYYQAGFHVVSLSSPTYANFIATASKSGVPGNLSEDADDLYRVMGRIWEKHRDKLQVSGFYLTGYSLGAANAAFVSRLDEQEQRFGFRKVLLINPPVSLFNSVNRIDAMLSDNLDVNDPASVNKFLARLLDRVAELYIQSERLTLDEDTLYKLYQHGQPKQESLSTLIGMSFRLSSANMIFTSDVMANQGLLKPKNLELGSADSLTDYLKASSRVTFIEYFDDYFLPYFQRQNPALTRDELLEQLSLRPLDSYIRGNDKLAMVTNADDLILAPDEVDYLRNLFGAQAKIFPNGGHCGNLAHPAFVSHITEVMRP
ncbi:MAG: alpha/beta hydrolase [Motiliproteus sp.]